jgi:hypothetical protein
VKISSYTIYLEMQPNALLVRQNFIICKKWALHHRSVNCLQDEEVKGHYDASTTVSEACIAREPASEQKRNNNRVPWDPVGTHQTPISCTNILSKCMK